MDFAFMFSIEKNGMSKSWKTVVTTPPQSEYNKHLLQGLLAFRQYVKGILFPSVLLLGKKKSLFVFCFVFPKDISKLFLNTKY